MELIYLLSSLLTGGVCSGRLKKGLFGAGTTRKGGSFVRTQLEKRGLRCGSGQKKRGGGGFTAIHTYMTYSYTYASAPRPPGATPGCISNTVMS